MFSEIDTSVVLVIFVLSRLSTVSVFRCLNLSQILRVNFNVENLINLSGLLFLFETDCPLT